MTTSHIITFYAIYIPICILAIILGLWLGYNHSKIRQMFTHIKIKNSRNAYKH